MAMFSSCDPYCDVSTIEHQYNMDVNGYCSLGAQCIHRCCEEELIVFVNLLNSDRMRIHIFGVSFVIGFSIVSSHKRNGPFQVTIARRYIFWATQISFANAQLRLFSYPSHRFDLPFFRCSLPSCRSTSSLTRSKVILHFSSGPEMIIHNMHRSMPQGYVTHRTIHLRIFSGQSQRVNFLFF